MIYLQTQTVEGHLNPGLFNPKLQPQTFQSWTLQPRTFQSWFFEPWGWKLHGWKVRGWKVHGWKVWGWSLGLKSPGLKCPSTTHLKCFYSFNFIIKILLQMNIKVIIVSLSKGVFTKLQNMIIIFSILFFSSIFTTNISGFKDPNLPEDFYSKWENSQVFIYYRMQFSQKFQSEYPYPNCFGNLLTAKLVLTATSCFIHLKERP